MNLKALFSPANLHRLIVLILFNVATAAQSLLSAGHWTWHTLASGSLGAALASFFGWYISTKGANPNTAETPTSGPP